MTDDQRTTNAANPTGTTGTADQQRIASPAEAREAKARHTARPEARATTFAITTNRE